MMYVSKQNSLGSSLKCLCSFIAARFKQVTSPGRCRIQPTPKVPQVVGITQLLVDLRQPARQNIRVRGWVPAGWKHVWEHR